MLKKFSRATLLVGAAIVCGGLSTVANALPFQSISQLYFFGDSLTDSGFNDLLANPPGPLPTGKAPTFTTYGGYTYAQYLARDIKGFVLPIYPGPVPNDLITNNAYAPGGTSSGTRNGIDYAAGGSTTNAPSAGKPSLVNQVNAYLASAGQADPNAVYFIFSGANDFINVLSPTVTELQLLQVANTAATNIANEAAILSARGAKRIVVMSLPNVGITPLVQGLAVTLNMPQLPAELKTVSFTFNSMLNQKLGDVVKRYNTKILLEDVYDLLDNVILATQQGRPYVVAGQSFRFTNYTDQSCAPATSSLFCPPNGRTGYLFADSLHPTDEAHRVLSLQVETDILNWV